MLSEKIILYRNPFFVRKKIDFSLPKIPEKGWNITEEPNTYIDKIASYSGEEVVFKGERTRDNYSVVETQVISPKRGVKIPVNYRLMKKGNEWFVYDVVIEGVSLVNNYRAQFNHIIQSSSYETLVKKIKDKLAQKS